jgi:peptidoglycan/xylan/chitin deacetylase (PgdA/CDA1 family)
MGILMYHRIAPPLDGRSLLPPWTVSPQQFRAQLDGLLAAGYQVWPLRNVLAHHARRQPFPPRVVALSFDDGYENFFTHAWPILRELSVPATVFLATAYLDGTGPMPFCSPGSNGCGERGAMLYRPLSLAQCAELLAAGQVDLGTHGHVHGDFRGRPDQFREDLLRSLACLRARLGVTGAGYAFPFGFFDPPMVAAARQAGVPYALTCTSELVRPGSNCFAWGRFAVEQSDTAATLAGKLSGWYELARRAWLGLRRFPRLEPAAAPPHPSLLVREATDR